MKILLILSVLGFVTAAQGAEESEGSIPAELASALSDVTETGEIRFSTTVPDGFPELDLPPELIFLGGMTHPNFVRVALSSEWEIDRAMPAILKSLESAAYQLVPQPREPSSGFVVEGLIPTVATVCHENSGEILVRFLIRGDNHYISLTGSSTPETLNTDCAERIAERQRFIDSQIARNAMGARAYLPRLVIPEEQGVDYRGFQPHSRFSGSDTEHVTVSSIKTRLGAEELFEHFSEQLQAQQWSQQKNSIGGNFHESEWILINEDDHVISGKLHIEKQNKDIASLRFSLSTSGMFFISEPRGPILQQGWPR